MSFSKLSKSIEPALFEFMLSYAENPSYEKKRSKFMDTWMWRLCTAEWLGSFASFAFGFEGLVGFTKWMGETFFNVKFFKVVN